MRRQGGQDRRVRSPGVDLKGLKRIIWFSRISIMDIPDVWEDAPSSRREATRYRTRWKVALAFDRSTDKPIFQTLTHDLSMNGTSVQNATDEELQTVLTLLLVPPSIDGTVPKVIKLKAVVMSSMPFRGGFRLGLRFASDPELDKLRAVLARHDLSGDTLPSDSHGEELPKLL
jgi:hypothetical protein